MNKMKPIIFSTPMVRAILEGRKTQTRRVINPQPTYDPQSDRWVWPIPKSKVHKGCCTEVCTASREWWEYLLPDQLPYQPGDILWVRETWARASSGIIEYKADYKEPFTDSTEIDHTGHKIKWRPSIFMPRDAARIFLKVKEVSVERLIDISDSDVVNEGFQTKNDFFALWDKLNYHRGFGVANNPFVWKIEFERGIRQNGGQD